MSLKIILILCLAMVVIPLSIACAKQRTADQSELKALVNNDSTFLVDVRSGSEFESGHAEGSVNIPVNLIESQLDKFKGKQNIVVFCRSGNRSNQAKKILEENGFTNVTNGGTWQNIEKLRDKK